MTVAVIALSLFILAGYTDVSAAKKDVTSQSSVKKKVQKLSNEFIDFTNYFASYELSDSKESAVFDFSKNNAREIFMAYTNGKHGKLDSNAQKKLSKQLFGKATSHEVAQIEGDWGAEIPSIKISKIYKLSGSKYQVKANLISFFEDEGVTEKTAALTMDLKKSSSAKYGYYMKKLTIKLPSKKNTAIKKLKTAKKKKALTKKTAKKKLISYLKKNKAYDSKLILEYDHKEGKTFVFHYYTIFGDHTVTTNWYYVNSKTGKITSML